MPQAPGAPELILSDLQLPAPQPARYTTEAELTESLARKGSYDPGDGLYPRDGREGVTRIEEAISELTIPGQRLNVVVPAGMAAVSGVIRFAMSYEGARQGVVPNLAYAQDLYPQATNAVMHLKNMGVAARQFNSGDPDAVERTAEGYANVLFAETVANTADMPVLDLHRLVAQTREMGDRAPLVAVDNTLPLSTGVDLEAILKPEDRFIVVESVTKTGLNNSDSLGVVYSKNPDLMDAFRRFKATDGSVTSTFADEAYLRALEATAASYHARNRALFESAATIAGGLAVAQQELGDDPEFVIQFPTLPDHPNHEYAEEHLVDGSSPLVWLGCTRLNQEEVARGLLRRISEHPRVREQIEAGQLYIGQSFGFREATLLYDPNASQVRISGGYGIDSVALAGALQEAAADI